MSTDPSSLSEIRELHALKSVQSFVSETVTDITITRGDTAAALSAEAATALGLTIPHRGTLMETHGEYMDQDGEPVYAKKDAQAVDGYMGMSDLKKGKETSGSLVHVYTGVPERSRGKKFEVFLGDCTAHEIGISPTFLGIPRIRHSRAHLWPLLDWTVYSVQDPQGTMLSPGGKVKTYLLFHTNELSPTDAPTEPNAER